MLTELQPFVEMLDLFFAEARKLLEGLNTDQLNRRPIQDEAREEASSSLYGLALHMSLVAMRGATQASGRQLASYPEMFQGNNGINTPGESADRPIQVLNEAQAFVRIVAESLTAAQLDELRERRFGNWVAEPKTVRWMMWHILEHTALHIGHMELTRQLVLKQA